ncbi:MAG: SMC family ATPase, partial [Oscillospiraceae bacterium]|nr:SMC family ATPase [Oscillospiraceae bacterium]
SVRGGVELRSDFALPETDTYAELKFEHRGQEYTVRRSPEYERPKLRGDGLTRQAANAELTLPDGKTVTKVNEVTKAVEELLRINMQQFKQLCMLAQGEFLKLLLASSGERTVIFRKIFDTGIFDLIQRELSNEERKYNQEFTAVQNGIIENCKRIVPGEDLPDRKNPLAQALETLDSDGVDAAPKLCELLDDQIGLDAEEWENLIKEKEAIDKQNQELAVAFEAAKEVEKKKIKLEEELKREPEIENYKNEIKKLNLDIINIEKARELAADHALLCDKRKQTVQVDIEINRLELQHEELSEIAAKSAQEFEEKQALEPERQRIYQDIISFQKLLPQYEQLDAKRKPLKEAVDGLKDADDKLDKLITQTAELKSQLQESEREHNRLEWADAEFQRLSAYGRELDTKARELTEIQSLFEDNSRQNKDIKAKQSDFEKLSKKYSGKKAEYDRAEAEFFGAQSGILAQHLVDGQPCPVCGATEHPSLARLSESATTQDTLEELKTQRDKLNEDCNKAARELDKIRTAADSSLNELKRRCTALQLSPEPDTILQNINETAKKRSENTKVAADVFLKAERRRKLSEQLAEMREKVNKYEQMLTEQRDRRAAHAQAVSAGQEGERMLAAAIPIDVPSLEQAQSRISALNVRMEEIDSAVMKASIATRQSEQQLAACFELLENTRRTKVKDDLRVKSLEEGFSAGLVSHGFTDEAEFVQVQSRSGQLPEMRQETDKLIMLCREWEETVRRLKTETENKDIESSSIGERLEKIKAKSAGLLTLSGQLKARIGINNNVLNELKLKLKQSEDLEKRLVCVRMLSNTANGNVAGKKKLKFEIYVQAAYFDIILAEANRRFSRMTDGRFELLRSDDPTSLTDKGLELDVFDHYTGKPRSVKSLSGGESFKASLSLALGLSDVVQRRAGGVSIDTMFVDEGFGSLDTQSLETAITTLNELTGSDRLVGIISHVAELRDRIDNQIIVHKTPRGSTLRVEV